MSHRKRTRTAQAATAAVTLGVLLAGTACSADGGTRADDTRTDSSRTGGERQDSAAAPAGFWGAHPGRGAAEADAPESLTELADRSDLVVLGTIAGAEEGRDYTDPGKPPNRTSNIGIRVEKSSKPGVTEAVVEFTREPGAELNDIAADLPGGRYVFYLTSWYQGPDGPVYSCASAARCVVSAEGGKLETPRDPEVAEELAEGTEAASAGTSAPDGSAPAKSQGSGASGRKAESEPVRLDSAEDVFALSTAARG
ncbi:hypothetical protein I3F58_10975 [Streptomyces sp. MUM 203J]|uniref:hypothetical protein n=1 Tax=Streptomyces sp. MUM 203J TaxID=2791990 RepID=UPI001F04B26B|nr:hypothetical protein [Streptomyces sp. MUM 203J]MCH0540080.1 hypothetical protein [Streptomyces sp. MUM 203J]